MTLNKFTQIRNDVIESLVFANLTATEYQISMVVIRKTWGWHKKQDWISYSQFMKVTGKSRISIWTALNGLVKKNILVKKTTLGKMTLYSFNKHFDEWLLVKKTELVKKSKLVKKTEHTSKVDLTRLVKKTEPTKETITKDTIQKKNNIVISKKNLLVELILEEFKNLYGFEPTDSKPRFEAWNLLRRLKKYAKELDGNVSDDRLKGSVTAYFKWVSQQGWHEMVQNLGTIRRKSNIFYAEEIEPRLKGKNER